MVWSHFPYVCTGMCYCYYFPFKGMGANNCFLEWSSRLIDNAGPDPAVSLTLRALRLWSLWHRGIRSCSVNDAAESAYAVSLRLHTLLQKCPSQQLWDLIPRYHGHHGIWTFQMIITFFSANGFSPWTRALGWMFDLKTEGKKSHDTVPLSDTNIVCPCLYQIYDLKG
jgi:hypothetical protein